MCTWVAEQGVEGIVNGQKILRATKDWMLWGAMIAQLLKGHEI